MKTLRCSLSKRLLISSLVLTGMMMVPMDSKAVVASAASDSPAGTSQMTKMTAASPKITDGDSGTIGTISWTFKNGVCMFTSAGEYSENAYETAPWYQDSTVTGFDIPYQIRLTGHGPAFFFSNLQNLRNIEGIRNIDVSGASSLFGMFTWDSSLTDLDLSQFYTSNSTNMDTMFFGNEGLTTLRLDHFDTAAAERHGLARVFLYDTKLSQITLSSHITASFLASLPDTGHQWVAVGSGTPENPQWTGDPISHSEFIKNPIIDLTGPLTSATYVWKRNFDLTFKNGTNDATVYEGQKWDPWSVIDLASSTDTKDKTDTYDNAQNVFVDENGQRVDKETIANEISKRAPGEYHFNYINGDVHKPFTLIIKQDQAALTVTPKKHFDQDQVITDADVRSEIKQAINSDGTNIPSENIHYTITDSKGEIIPLDQLTQNPGQYTVTFTTDPLLSGVTKTATMTIDVAKDQTSLKLKQPSQTITAGQLWHPIDDFASATDAAGKPVDFKDITVTATDEKGNPVKDLSTLHKTPGVYTVTYKNGNMTETLKLTVKKATVPVTPGGNPPSVTPPASSSSASSSSSAVTPSQPTPPSQPGPQLPNYAGVKGSAVYAIKKIGLYRNTSFTKANRQRWYANKPRIYRPMFVITGYARSITGKLRYQVTDVNHQSKTAGMTGYITTSRKYVSPVYYATKHTQITVISPKGVHAYKREDLTGKLTTYKQGTVLKVKGIMKHNLTTRFILSNGKYVTANRKLVNMGRHAQVTKVRAKTSVNRYATVNLTNRNRHFKKGTVLKVHHSDYSRGHDFNQRGTLRYRVAGGYVSGNSKYVHVYY